MTPISLGNRARNVTLIQMVKLKKIDIKMLLLELIVDYSINILICRTLKYVNLLDF